MLAVQRGLEPLLHQQLAGLTDCVDCRIQCCGALAIAPSIACPRGIGLLQNPSLRDLPCWAFTFMDQCVEAGTILIAKLNDVFLYGNLLRGHDTSLSLRNDRVRDGCQNQLRGR